MQFGRVAAISATGAVWLARPWLPGNAVVVLLLGAGLAHGLTALMIAAFPTGRETLREGWGLLAGFSARRSGAVAPPEG
jgi:PST family polysaccharide transporter